MVVTATEIKNRLGYYLQMAITNPVVIEKNHNAVAVILSNNEYERLVRLEDSYWAERAAQAEAEGFIGEQESMALIKAAGRVKA